MIVSAMQPYFFPYIGYFQLIAQSDVFVFRDEAQYIKGGWINRNRILDRNGRDAWIVLPVAAASHQRAINERCYVRDGRNFGHVARQIENAYLRAANSREIFPLLEEILAFDNANVAAFNINLVQRIAARQNLKTQFIRASHLPLTPDLAGQARVIEICRLLKATRYINPVGGAELYDAQAFGEHGIELGFLQTDVESRPGPAPYLSIVHTLMTESHATIETLLDRYGIMPGH